MKNFIALLLSVFMIIPIFTSCRNNAIDENATESTTEHFEAEYEGTYIATKKTAKALDYEGQEYYLKLNDGEFEMGVDLGKEATTICGIYTQAKSGELILKPKTSILYSNSTKYSENFDADASGLTLTYADGVLTGNQGEIKIKFVKR